MLIGILLSPISPEPARAAGLTTSEAMVDVIKKYEGFRTYIYWDGGYAYIGYGTRVNSWDYPNGISKEGADALMRDALKLKEDELNAKMDKYGVTLTQGQFDALMSFTYNIGTSWMRSGNRIFDYLTNGVENYTDIEIVNAIGVWCHMYGGQVIPMLAVRRLHEAKIFLYDDYANSDMHQYIYLEYDAGEGEAEQSMIFYEVGVPYGAFQPAELAGYTLTGWQTEDGVLLSIYDTATTTQTVCAVWASGTVEVVQEEMFSDVSPDDWFYKYVNPLCMSGVVNGYEDGTFRPGNSITSGEALKLILRAVGFSEQTNTSTHWASGYLTLAASKGIADDTLIVNLDVAITRRAVAEITAKSLGLPPIEEEGTFLDTSDGFVNALYRCDISYRRRNG